jgi:hypothetical protein
LRTFLHVRNVRNEFIVATVATLVALSVGGSSPAGGLTVGRVIEQPSRVTLAAEQRFHRLTEAWRASRGPASTVAKIAMHPAYQQIIGMGVDALPLILRELEREPDHWFWALEAITGENPVPPTDRGRLNEMARAWLRWASEHSI